MAAVYQSLSTKNCFNLGEGGVVAPAVIDKPSGTVEGDLLVTFAFAAVTNTSNVTTLSGWTLLSGKDSSTGADVHAYVWYKIAGPSEPAQYSWTVDNTSFGWTGQFTCLRIDGHHASSFIHDWSPQPSSAGTTKTSAATDTIANGLLIYAGGVDGNGPGSDYWTTPSGMTERQDVSGGGDVMVGIFTEETASTTANVTRSSTIDTSEDAVVYLISIAPAAGGTSATLTVTAATATAQAEAVTFDVAANLTAAAATATAQAEGVTLDAASVLTITAASATAAAQAVNLAAAQSATFTVGAATATAQAEAVTLDTAAVLVVTASSATAQAEAVTLDAAAVLTVTAATATAQAEAITLDAAAVFTVAPAGATAQAEDVVLAAAAPPQLIYPVADISDGGWTPSTGTELYAVIDEASPNDADYAQSSQSPASADAMRVQLGSVTDPGVNTGHIVRYRLGKDAAGGDSLEVTARLYQGATLIATDAVRTVPDAFTTYQWDIDEVGAANITDYADLRLDISAEVA